MSLLEEEQKHLTLSSKDLIICCDLKLYNNLMTERTSLKSSLEIFDLVEDEGKTMVTRTTDCWYLGEDSWAI